MKEQRSITNDVPVGIRVTDRQTYRHTDVRNELNALINTYGTQQSLVRRPRHAARTTGNFTMQINAEATLALYSRYSLKRHTHTRISVSENVFLVNATAKL